MYTPISGKAHASPSESEARLMVRDVLDTLDQTPPEAVVRKAFRKRGNLPPLLDVEGDAVAVDTVQSQRATKVKSVTKHVGFGLSRLRRKHFWWASVLGLAYWSPVTLAVIFFSVVLVITLAFLMIGAERIWKGVILAIREIEGRNPGKAHRMRKKIQAFGARWNGILDRFPDGWMDDRYMPDLQALEAQDLDHATIVAERLRRLPEQA